MMLGTETPSLGSVCFALFCAQSGRDVGSRDTNPWHCLCRSCLFQLFCVCHLFLDVHPLRKKSQRTYTLDISMGDCACIIRADCETLAQDSCAPSHNYQLAQKSRHSLSQKSRHSLHSEVGDAPQRTQGESQGHGRSLPRG